MTFTHDGTVFDLDIEHADVFGTHWTWTGEHSPAGEPLMQSIRRPYGPGRPSHTRPYDSQPLPLPDVYAMYGPLIPIHPTRINDAAWTRGVAA
ncbi:phiSA1p31-related protein [Streptomyces sp. NPDC007025]|uniref:phiSA1p31-related protein n=1 Tax=Streptomyces sp. NPDC007025 TaxID=3364771 RepID=UPI0036CCD42E